MSYCPNCSAELKSLTDSACWNCQAIFNDPAGWRPTEKPAGEFRPFQTKKLPGTEHVVAQNESTTGVKILKGLIVLPLILCGLVLFRFGLGQISFLLLFLSLAVVASRTRATKIISMGLGALALLLTLFFGAFILVMLASKI